MKISDAAEVFSDKRNKILGKAKANWYMIMLEKFTIKASIGTSNLYIYLIRYKTVRPFR